MARPSPVRPAQRTPLPTAAHQRATLLRYALETALGREAHVQSALALRHDDRGTLVEVKVLLLGVGEEGTGETREEEASTQTPLTETAPSTAADGAAEQAAPTTDEEEGDPFAL